MIFAVIYRLFKENIANHLIVKTCKYLGTCVFKTANLTLLQFLFDILQQRLKHLSIKSISAHKSTT